MQVGANSQLNFVFFIPCVCSIASLIFIFSVIRTRDYRDYINILKSQRVWIVDVRLYQ